VEIGVLPTIEADPTQMRQLFLNLIGNALKFHRPGEPPVVKVDAKAVQGANKSSQTEADLSCEITVADNGIGFADTYLNRIFEVFQRLHGRQEYDGTGMGLPICKTIVERHGGSITARSEPGKGATFIVTLPLKQAKEETNQWQSTRSPLPS
jgi:signal transduction histidine kinase